MRGETVTVIPGVGYDSNGDPLPAGSVRDIEGCAIEPRVAGENDERGRQGVVIGYVVYAPRGARVAATDQLRIRGDVFDVDGDIAVWVNPYTRVERGVVITTKRGRG